MAKYNPTPGNWYEAFPIAHSIVNGDITHPPDGNSVFDALALKADVPTVNHWTRSGSVAPAGTFNLPSITHAAVGCIVVGDNLYSASFRTDNVGNVQLIDSDSGGVIVANADTNLKVAIGDAAATDIIPVTNRTAEALNIMVILDYI